MLVFISALADNWPSHLSICDLQAGTRISAFWTLLELRMMKMEVTTGAIRRVKFQSNRLFVLFPFVAGGYSQLASGAADYQEGL